MTIIHHENSKERPFYPHLCIVHTRHIFFPVKMELGFSWDAQMIPLSKPILVIPLSKIISKFLAHCRGVEGQEVPMGGPNFKMKVFKF